MSSSTDSSLLFRNICKSIQFSAGRRRSSKPELGGSVRPDYWSIFVHASLASSRIVAINVRIICLLAH
nr:unnamed protein product [Callosobruchus chinensis]